MSIHFRRNIIKVKMEMKLKNLTAINIGDGLCDNVLSILTISLFRIEIVDKYSNVLPSTK